MEGNFLKNQPYIQKTKSHTHITPKRVWKIIKEEYGYNKSQFYDPCPANSKFNGLTKKWRKLNYINPPYDQIGEFVDKAISESIENKISIMLLPSKTDKAWFHKLIRLHYNITWIEKRLTFEGESNPAPQPHFLVMI